MSTNYYTNNSEDSIDGDELALYRLIMDYRASVGLPEIPLSAGLTAVAGRHALDSVYNTGYVGHSWSDAPYDSADSSTYPNSWYAPQRLNTSYDGIGYEISVGYLGDPTAVMMTPEVALDAWQNSPGHNVVIVNAAPWTQAWGAIGVGMHEGIAHVWFGHEADPGGAPVFELSIADTGQDTAINADPSHDGVFWQSGNGDVSVWGLNDGGALTSSWVGQRSTEFSFVATGDLAADGVGDIIWRKDNGDVSLWDVNADGSTTFSWLGKLSEDYTIVGVADFTGDGYDDILWRKESGDVSLWDMNSDGSWDFEWLGQRSAEFSIEGVGDFTGDGVADVLWRKASGDVSLWDQNGDGTSDFRWLGKRSNDYEIQGVGDFTGDNVLDVLWRKDSGDVSVWDQNSGGGWDFEWFGQRTSSFTIAGVGDLTGDDVDDVLWRKDGGDVSLWDLNSGGGWDFDWLGKRSEDYAIQSLDMIEV